MKPVNVHELGMTTTDDVLLAVAVVLVVIKLPLPSLLCSSFGSDSVVFGAPVIASDTVGSWFCCCKQVVSLIALAPPCSKSRTFLGGHTDNNRRGSFPMEGYL
jgi:hypothetical protein